MLIGIAMSNRVCKPDEPPVGLDPCTPPEPDIIIVTPPNDERCHEVLTLLTANDDSVDNTCDYETIDGKLIYNFHFYYRLPFVFDATCLQHFIDFEGTNIPQGAANYWEYTFDGVHIMFSIPHLDLALTTCQKITEDDQYIWQCNIGLHIFYQGMEQYDYQFIMTSTVSRYYVDTLTINIAKNIVIGDCCLNLLEIDTKLEFCSDISCATYLPSPLSVLRKDIFYVEHRILTAEFAYYYLHNVQLKVGEFFPVILSKNSSLTGKIRWELQVNVAMNNMIVESIVKIDEIAEARRRYLTSSNDEIGDDYMVKAQTGKIIVTDAPAIRRESRNKSNSAANLTFLAGLLLLLTILL